MRNKVILIKGWGNLSPKITLAEHERINADYVVLITALKFPYTLPEGLSDFGCNPGDMLKNIKGILKNWILQEQEYMVAAEYANIALEKSKEKIRAVEGLSLEIDWFYDTIKNFHRNFGQIIINAKLETKFLILNNKKYLIEEAIELLKPESFLG